MGRIVDKGRAPTGKMGNQATKLFRELDNGGIGFLSMDEIENILETTCDEEKSASIQEDFKRIYEEWYKMDGMDDVHEGGLGFDPEGNIRTRKCGDGMMSLVGMISILQLI